MLRFKEYLTDIMEAKSDATTFFHEVICGIACFDPVGAATIGKGSDVKQFFDNGTISARKGTGETTEADITSLPQFRFIDDTVDVDGNIISKDAGEDFWKKGNLQKRADDAVSLARIIRENLDSRVGVPKKPILWTGPTNDASDYGASDIAYNKQGISLKFGKGQFKNLTVDAFARTALGTGSDASLLKELQKTVPEKWDDMTSTWLYLIQKSLFSWDVGRQRNAQQQKTKEKALVEAKKIFHKRMTGVVGNWSNYQKLKITDKEVQVYHDLLYSGKKGQYDKNDTDKRHNPNYFRYLCRKLYDQGTTSTRKDWKTKRNDHFTNIFGTYFSDRDETIKANLHTVFERQISVGEKSIMYAAKGGRDFKRIPSKAEFDATIKNIDFTYEGKTTGAGYTFILKAAQKGSAGKPIPIMDISIFFRFKSNGQMVGNPDTSSDSKMYIEDYADIFDEIK
jgi:hypothetical protein